MTLYLDNAATSFPKPFSVYQAVEYALKEVGANPGRGAHRLAREAMDIIAAARSNISELLGIPDPERVMFTKNATESLNVALKGWLHPGNRVLASAVEHNSVMRPLQRLRTRGVTVETIPCSSRGQIDLDCFRKQLGSPGGFDTCL
jgi:cysteine desulfurase/selenocysteine lyase